VERSHAHPRAYAHVCSVLIEEYTLYDPNIEIICYVDGYKGLLKGRHPARNLALNRKP